MRLLFLALLIANGFYPICTLAQTDEFNIRLFAGDDTEVPSTPTLISATPVAASQINLTWSTSTDNWIFGGYVLWRDGSPIATTTETIYSDTGLSPDTLYFYNVYTFDAAGNYSSSSNVLTATTTPLPPVSTSTPNASSSVDTTATKTILLREFSLAPNDTGASILWTTNIPSRFTLRWGRTEAYTDGYIVNETYASRQTTELQNLEPGSIYYYELIGYSPAGVETKLKRGQFATVDEADDSTPQNVEKLRAEVIGEDVILRYELPAGFKDARVRIVRSHLGFPVGLVDGAIIYEGTADKFTDGSALRTHGTQYYTVFLIGVNGAVSSGAVVIANRFSFSGSEEEDVSSSDPNDLSAGQTMPEILVPLLDYEDIGVIQRDRIYSFLSERINLSPESPFIVRIYKDALPPHLKSIIITLSDPTDQRRKYSFLLRLDKFGMAYEAAIAPLSVLGTSRLQVEIYDFESLVVGRYQTQLNFVSGLEADQPVIFPDALVKPFKIGGVLLGSLFVILLSGWLVMVWRRRHTEDKL